MQVAALVAAIPKDLLARAAHACGAHARALQYYELHVRDVKGNRLNSMADRPPAFTDQEVSFLQVDAGSHVVFFGRCTSAAPRIPVCMNVQ